LTFRSSSLALLLFAATLAAPLAAQAPRLTIDQPTADLGTVGVG
jgi:hypothetical protein